MKIRNLLIISLLLIQGIVYPQKHKFDFKEESKKVLDYFKNDDNPLKI